MFCSSCGAQLNEDAKFCARCGAPVAAARPVSDGQPVPEREVVPERALAPEREVVPEIQPVPIVQPGPSQPQPVQPQPQPIQPQYTQQPPVQPQYTQQQMPPNSYPPVVPAGQAANMPSLTVAKVLIVIGFLCGIIWGVVGFTQYKPMKEAIMRGDADTAHKDFRIIAIASALGIVVNVIFLVMQLS